MPLFAPRDRDAAHALQAINYANPFLPERLELERRVLGAAYVDVGPARSLRPDDPDSSPNFAPLVARAEALVARARERLRDASAAVDRADLERFEDLAIQTLYHRWIDRLADRIAGRDTSARVRVPWYEEFERDARDTLRPGGRRLPRDLQPAHLLALFFQVARAFHRIFANILGSSAAAMRLRAEVWQSIFTHDIRRYQSSLFERMADIPTLVTGPSGTGKELVARAVGLSTYLPFDTKSRSFEVSESERFLPLNLSALSPTLIESELFGHRRGAFTGALEARTGWFELCPPHGAVFLDEIGELATDIQVKLLRVLQTRTFQRLGDSEERTFRGKVISATNRDLAEGLAAGTFREDFFYRICSDRIVTPSLAEQIAGSMEELETLAVFIARGLVGDEAPALAAEVVSWVDAELGADYAWPGNFRELEQCVRSVLVRKLYRPQTSAAHASAAGTREGLAAALLAGRQTADRTLRDYCTLVYAELGTYEGAARRLGLDRRTVKAKVDPALLERLR